MTSPRVDVLASRIPASPAELQQLSEAQLDELTSHLREQLIRIVARSGGHVGPNLGVLELTIALHRVFSSPRDPIVFDTGHQAYVHKMLTGRADLAGLRTEGGTSGYPSRAESEHDLVENSHASGSLGWALGLGMAFAAASEDRVSVAVIGDGALTGGVALEALNLAPDHRRSQTVFILNDNLRSYAPTVGALARHLDELRSGSPAGRSVFDALGYTVIGPVDGHDVHAIEAALREARRAALGEAIPLVHVVTAKGRGLLAAEMHEADQWHAHGPFDITAAHAPAQHPETPAGGTWTDHFSDAILSLARQSPHLVALSAAMVDPVGLTAMQRTFPHRVLDTGIAEQVTLDIAAGLAHAGQRPIVALYSTFLTRAIDQLLMDIALHREPVTITLDRAGITGEDGASHHGMWDLGLAAQVPGLEVFAPRDAVQLEAALTSRLTGPTPEGPGLIRFPKGAAPAAIPALRSTAAGDVLLDAPVTGAAPVVIVSYGALADRAVAAGEKLAAAGIAVTVIDPVRALPIAPALLDLLATARAVITLEDGVRQRGIGAAVLVALADRGESVPVRLLGVDQAFIDHASRAAILEREGLTAEAIAQAALSMLT